MCNLCCKYDSQIDIYNRLEDENIDNLNKTMGEIVGELNNLKNRLISLQNENIKLKKENVYLREKIRNYKDNNNSIGITNELVSI